MESIPTAEDHKARRARLDHPEKIPGAVKAVVYSRPVRSEFHSANLRRPVVRKPESAIKFSAPGGCPWLAPPVQVRWNFSPPVCKPLRPVAAPTMRQVLREVSRRRDVPEADLLSASRFKHIAYVRQEVMWEIRHRCPSRSLPEIGRFLRKDHTTVMYGIKAHQARLDNA